MRPNAKAIGNYGLLDNGDHFTDRPAFAIVFLYDTETANKLLCSKFWSAQSVGGFLALVDGNFAAGVFENATFCAFNSICSPFCDVLGAVRI